MNSKANKNGLNRGKLKKTFTSWFFLKGIRTLIIMDSELERPFLLEFVHKGDEEEIEMPQLAEPKETGLSLKQRQLYNHISMHLEDYLVKRKRCKISFLNSPLVLLNGINMFTLSIFSWYFPLLKQPKIGEISKLLIIELFICLQWGIFLQFSLVLVIFQRVTGLYKITCTCNLVHLF